MIKQLIAIILTTFACLQTYSLYAQERKFRTRAEIEALVHPAVMQEGEQILQFDSLRISLGTLNEEDNPRTVAFVFRNISQQTVTVTRVNTTCGCTVAAFSHEPIAPDKSSTIRLTYHPKNRIGTIDAEAFVYIQQNSTSPIAKLTLTGNVITTDEWRYLPHAMGTLRLNRKQLVFNEMSQATQPSERILCANSGSTPLKISARLIPPYAQLHTEPAMIQPGQEGDIVITIDKKHLPHFTGKQMAFNILLEGVQGRPSERTIEIIINK